MKGVHEVVNMPPRSIDPSILRGVQHHLDGLKKTPEGALLYSLIERGLERYGAGDRLEQSFLQFVNTLLRKYVQDPKSDPATRFKAKLIQSRLQLNGTPTPSAATAAGESVLLRGAAASVMPSVISMDEPAKIAAMPAANSAPMADPAHIPTSSIKPIARETAMTTPSNAQWESAADEKPPESPARPVVVAVEQALATDVAATLTRDEGFERLMKQNAAVFSQLGGTEGARDIESLLFTGLEQLIEGHQQLGANLQRATNYLKLMQTDRDQLRRQLWRVRKSSLVDEGTGLANRTALMRQLTAEMSRSRRYGGSLALTLIAIDDFESFRKNHGEEIAKHALDVYGTRILRVFRTYDFAARYGNESFAVLFPHTDRDGALRAVEKALMRVANTRIAGPAGDIVLPTFSAVIALPTAKEKASSLLRRTDEALTRIVAAAKPHTVICLTSDSTQAIPLN